MRSLDACLSLLIPALILIHLLIAPFTKVEESFNIQATHDIAYSNGKLNKDFDHLSFPGAVPRTFVGAVVLAAVSKPLIWLASFRHAQFIVRAILGMVNASALLRYKSGLTETFGIDVGRWYVLLQASQFHVIFYASRTLPNMFAFVLTTLAFREFLPSKTPSIPRKVDLGISLLVFAGVIFRSEIALLLATELLYLLIQGRITLTELTPTGIRSAVVALLVSVPIDSYYWHRAIWPELAGFYYNAIQGKSAEWGTSPYIYYFGTLLPRLLLNPLITLALIPLSVLLPATRSRARELVIPSILFIAIYSLQPHKESRFIIYAVPPLTSAASLAASYIWTRRTKGIIYRLGSLTILASVVASFAGSSTMLFISSLNYPGGEAMSQLHEYIQQNPPIISSEGSSINIHMDVLSCMTGVTRFEQMPPVSVVSGSLPVRAKEFPNIIYDKTEDDRLLDPQFWTRFDYALMEEPGKAIGKWEIIGTVYAYAGIEILQPGDGSALSGDIERAYAANNMTKTKDGEELALESEEVQDAAESVTGLDSVATRSEARSLANLRAMLKWENITRFGIYNLVRDGVRLATGGWWVGPRMEPAIRILKRVTDPLP